jgi:hypothetical protein
MLMRMAVRFRTTGHFERVHREVSALIEEEGRSPSASRKSLPPLRRSRSGGYAGGGCGAVRSKGRAGRPSFGGRRTIELRHQCQLPALSAWQCLYCAQAILLKDRSRRSAFGASVQQPASNLGLPNPALQPTCYGWLRQPTQAAERQR